MNDGRRSYGAYQPGRHGSAGRSSNRRRREKYFKLSLAIFVLMAVAGTGLYLNHNDRASARQTELAVLSARNQKQKNFKAVVDGIISENQRVDISVAAIDLRTGRLQAAGKHSPMAAASTTKVLIACLYLHQVEQGQRKVAEKVSGYGGYEAIKQLINRSNEAVWVELISQLGKDRLKSYAIKIGINDYDPYKNYISSRGMAKLLQKLYLGELLNKKNTDLVLSYMQKTNYENFIPPALPGSLILHHKVGLFEDQVNDAAIISNGKNPFVLVVFTNGNGSYEWGQRAVLIQKITRQAVLAYI